MILKKSENFKRFEKLSAAFQKIQSNFKSSKI